MSICQWISTSNTSFTNTSNWSGGAVPVNGDTIVFDQVGTANLTLNTSTSLTSIIISEYQSSQAQIGDGTNYLVIGASNVDIGLSTGQGNPTGSTRIMDDFGSNVVTVNVHASASSSADTYYPPIQLKGNSITLNASGGSTGIGVRPGETPTVLSLNITQTQGTNPSVFAGAGATVVAATMNGGTYISQSGNVSNTTMNGGIYTYQGTGGHGTLAIAGGTCYYNGTGNIATCSLGGTLDFSGDTRNKTITSMVMYAGSTLNANNGVPGSIVFTNPIQLSGCTLAQVNINTPTAVTIQIL